MNPSKIETSAQSKPDSSGKELLTPRECASAALLTARLAYNVQETAEMLGICEKSVRRLIMRGLLRRV